MVTEISKSYNRQSYERVRTIYKHKSDLLVENCLLNPGIFQAIVPQDLTIAQKGIQALGYAPIPIQ